MNTNDVILVYIKFKDKHGGKQRPALLYSKHNNYIEIMSITSKYENKSEKIKRNYYPINNWREAGLKKESWIDIGNIHVFMKDTLRNINTIYLGKLTEADEIGLAEFSKGLRKRG